MSNTAPDSRSERRREAFPYPNYRDAELVVARFSKYRDWCFEYLELCAKLHMIDRMEAREIRERWLSVLSSNAPG